MTSDSSYTNDIKSAVKIGAAVAVARRARAQTLDSRDISLTSLVDMSRAEASQVSIAPPPPPPLMNDGQSGSLDLPNAPLRLNPLLLARLQREHGGSFASSYRSTEDSAGSSKALFDSESELPLEAYDHSPGRSPMPYYTGRETDASDAVLGGAPPEHGSLLPRDSVPDAVSPEEAMSEEMRERSISFSAVPRSVSHESDLPRSRSGSAVHARFSSGSLFELALQRRRTSSMKSMQQHLQQASASAAAQSEEGDEQGEEQCGEESVFEDSQAFREAQEREDEDHRRQMLMR